jgi:two-component system nitrogen regulation sensor histidine kinase NtrY
MVPRARRNPELNRLYFAVGLGVLIWVIFRCYRLLSAQVESGIDAPSRWALLALGLANVLAIGTLLFIVARSLAKLYFERRSGILGARIRTRLVVALFLVGLGPSLMLFLIGRTFIRKNVDRWFLPDTQEVIQDGRKLAAPPPTSRRIPPSPWTSSGAPWISICWPGSGRPRSPRSRWPRS